jgi:polyphosphate kinase 2 (PPK2 family)
MSSKNRSAHARRAPRSEAVSAVEEAPRLSGAGKELSTKEYDKAMKDLHVELVKLQMWVQHKGLKVCIIFEGRDGAGKGGTIKAITERVSPRVFRVVALPAPDRAREVADVHPALPAAPAGGGEVVIFDRSWYNRAGVERVMGFCTREQAEPSCRWCRWSSGHRRLGRHPAEVLARGQPEEQTRRFKSRFEDGRKIWKLTPMDLKSYGHWYDYSRARDAMFAATDTDFAPWYSAFRRQEEGPPQHHQPPAQAGALQGTEARKDQAAGAPGAG